MRQLSAVIPALFLTACAAQNAPPAAQAPAAKPMYQRSELRPLTAAEKARLTPLFSASLKDPRSAEYRWGLLPIEAKDGTIPYCGQVNAKNSYGGYVGFKPFQGFISMEKGRIISAQMAITGSGDFETQYVAAACRKEGLDPYLAE